MEEQTVPLGILAPRRVCFQMVVWLPLNEIEAGGSIW
jgi:hypothetical protein